MPRNRSLSGQFLQSLKPLPGMLEKRLVHQVEDTPFVNLNSVVHPFLTHVSAPHLNAYSFTSPFHFMFYSSIFPTNYRLTESWTQKGPRRPSEAICHPGRNPIFKPLRDRRTSHSGWAPLWHISHCPPSSVYPLPRPSHPASVPCCFEAV